jgi:hypothetical protein
MGCAVSCTPLGAPSLTGTSSLRCWVAGLEGYGVPGRFELWSSGFEAADLKEANVDSKSMGDAVPSSLGFGAADLEGNGNGVSGRLGPGSPAVDITEANAVLKSVGDDVLSSSDSPAGKSGDGSGVTRSNTRTSGPSGTNLTPFFGRMGGGVGRVACDGRCWDGWAFRRCLGLMSPVRLLTKLEPCLIGDRRG